MKTVTISQKLAEEILDQLKDAQADCYVQDTQDVIDELNEALRIRDVVGQSEQLVCDCGNRLTDKEMYFGQCLQCDKNIEE